MIYNCLADNITPLQKYKFLVYYFKSKKVYAFGKNTNKNIIFLNDKQKMYQNQKEYPENIILQYQNCTLLFNG